jgi:hypothetical protein
LIGGFGNILAPVREPREEGGNHRTEVTEATEEEFGGWWLVALWKHSGSRARTTRREGNHRTEVTEATGEELGLMGFPTFCNS